MFPGQGAQKIGMGKDIYDEFSCAREVFCEVDDAISQNLSNLIFNGSDDDLRKTENTQPALMAVSIAFLRVLTNKFGINMAEKTKFFAGHSLGEYTALCAAGVISLSDTARILKIRGKAMAEACPNGGGMAAILGLDINSIQKVIDEISNRDDFLQIANDNAPGQIIISGYKHAIQKATEKLSKQGAKTIMLEVSGPFHSELMQEAIHAVTDILNKTKFTNPLKPIISNVTANVEVDNFKDLLTKQIKGSVRWRESILFAKEHGVSKYVEIGSGKILTGLVKRILSEVETFNVNDVESLKNFSEYCCKTI
jgi:[acyl-carrier-protein] S-malonyltransferase